MELFFFITEGIFLQIQRLKDSIYQNQIIYHRLYCNENNETKIDLLCLQSEEEE